MNQKYKTDSIMIHSRSVEKSITSNHTEYPNIFLHVTEFEYERKEKKTFLWKRIHSVEMDNVEKTGEIFNISVSSELSLSLSTLLNRQQSNSR